jgi:hypothetical protein
VSAFGLIVVLYLLVGLLCIPLAIWLSKRFEQRAQQAHWRLFDDTHYWDAMAEDWVHYEGPAYRTDLSQPSRVFSRS